MANVASVKFGKEEPSRTGPILIIVSGVLCLVVGLSLNASGVALAGLIVAIIGAAWWVLRKTTYSVILSSASGEMHALSSNDAEYIQNVINALNEAIVQRG